ncbi:uncharacterized protein LOC116934524 [Daphnia magna]|uniref:uncharacterized protein LOC116934524 n=1 Tax=Daphnia magna TaxID=35525 RepID=UPI001E1BADF0|nr:uncharacterized protein LOC116934524 [Daphnia magna]
MSGKQIVKKKKLSIEEKTAISLEKKLARDKRKADARWLKRNPLNLPFVSRYGDFKEENNEILARKAVNKVSKMKGLVNKNPVEESETDLLPHNGNELEQHSSTSAYDTMSTGDSCAITVLLSCLLKKKDEAAEGEKAENLWKEKQEDVYKAFVTSHASSAHGRLCSSDGCLNFFLTMIFAVMIVNVTSAIAAINPFIFGYRSINEYGLIRKALRYWTTHNLLRKTDQFPSKVPVPVLFLQLSKSVNRLLFKLLLETTFVSSLLRMEGLI